MSRKRHDLANALTSSEKKAIEEILKWAREAGTISVVELDHQLPASIAKVDQIDAVLLQIDEGGVKIEDPATAPKHQAPPNRAIREMGYEDDSHAREIYDPVRVYLSQMGSIPVLKRDQETVLARTIELMRKGFRRKVLESDYAVAKCLKLFRRIGEGDVSFARTFQTAGAEGLGKKDVGDWTMLRWTSSLRSETTKGRYVIVRD